MLLSGKDICVGELEFVQSGYLGVVCTVGVSVPRSQSFEKAGITELYI